MIRVSVIWMSFAFVGSHPVSSQTCTWTPQINDAPKFQGRAPTATLYTVYQPADRKRVTLDVLNATANGSFVSRALRVITVEGTGKNFEMITGQDGLTFGVGDFATSDSVFAWMEQVNARHADKVKAAFGENADKAVSRRWISENNAPNVKGALKNDNGLIATPWFRQGLARLLCDPEIRAVQLVVWKTTKVDPSKQFFDEQKFRLELTLASMIGLANSMGIGGMKTLFRRSAAKATSSDSTARELEITRESLTSYVTADPHRKPGDSDAARRLLSGGSAACDSLGHRAKRVCMITRHFEPTKTVALTEIGSFAIK